MTLTNENTGLSMSTVTDETGTYTIRNIAGGTYTLKASLQGFKEFVQTGIPMVVGNIVRVNGQLEVGALTESVTVTVGSARSSRPTRPTSASTCGRRTSPTCR